LYIAPKVGTLVVRLLHRLFFDACALQHGNAHAVVAGGHKTRLRPATPQNTNSTWGGTWLPGQAGESRARPDH